MFYIPAFRGPAVQIRMAPLNLIYNIDIAIFFFIIVILIFLNNKDLS